jgi:hypothetical protein
MALRENQFLDLAGFRIDVPDDLGELVGEVAQFRFAPGEGGAEEGDFGGGVERIERSGVPGGRGVGWRRGFGAARNRRADQDHYRRQRPNRACEHANLGLNKPESITRSGSLGLGKDGKL